MTRVDQVLEEIASQYPESLRGAQRLDIARQRFHLKRLPSAPCKLADVAGGIGLFSPSCAAMGYDVWLIDDLRDPVNQVHPIGTLGVHERHGVRILERSAREWAKEFPNESFDCITCFEAMEHWHGGARQSLREAVRLLTPGGHLFYSAPNAASLFNRILSVTGRNTWSKFEDWYSVETFRGHVREPVKDDLLRIAEDLGLVVVGVWGRNYSGYQHASIPRAVMRAMDFTLRTRPSLCMEIYVLARKPISPGSANGSDS